MSRTIESAASMGMTKGRDEERQYGVEWLVMLMPRCIESLVRPLVRE